MNDVLNSQGYTQAIWWNRIPVSAWSLMVVIAIFCNVMIGYSARSPEVEPILPLILPLIVAIAFFLIADIESPRRGLIRVSPQNLLSLSQSLHPQ
jgi:protein-S-isoprenylcysteine O-methyltransferase Ste14